MSSATVSSSTNTFEFSEQGRFQMPLLEDDTVAFGDEELDAGAGKGSLT
jgi:hypothetical protein